MRRLTTPIYDIDKPVILISLKQRQEEFFLLEKKDKLEDKNKLQSKTLHMRSVKPLILLLFNCVWSQTTTTTIVATTISTIGE